MNCNVNNFFISLFSAALLATTISASTVNEPATFTSKELSEAIDKTTPQTNDKKWKAKQKLKAITDKLSEFKVTGYSFCTDFNIAFISNTQDPEFTVHYKNGKGHTKTRKFKANISSIGFKFEIEYKLNFIFFIGTDLNFYNTNKTLEIETGIDFKSNLIDITYAKFSNAPGGMLIVGVTPIGNVMTLNNYEAFTNHDKFMNDQVKNWAKMGIPMEPSSQLKSILYILVPGLSLVTGGHLAPISE